MLTEDYRINFLQLFDITLFNLTTFNIKITLTRSKKPRNISLAIMWQESGSILLLINLQNIGCAMKWCYGWRENWINEFTKFISRVFGLTYWLHGRARALSHKRVHTITRNLVYIKHNNNRTCNNYLRRTYLHTLSM